MRGSFAKRSWVGRFYIYLKKRGTGPASWPARVVFGSGEKQRQRKERGREKERELGWAGWKERKRLEREEKRDFFFETRKREIVRLGQKRREEKGKREEKRDFCLQRQDKQNSQLFFFYTNLFVKKTNIEKFFEL